MRISDWSSDVCSSDLVKARLGAVRLAELAELIGPRVIERIDPEAVAEVRDLGDHRFAVEIEEPQAVDHILVRAGDESFRGVDEIGRASCRERVCQYE